MKKREYIVLAAVLLLVILAPHTSFAGAPVTFNGDSVSAEFHVYNGFTPTVNAFTNIALTFSDSRYQYGAWVMMILGLIVAGTYHYMRSMGSGDVQKAGSLNWMIPVFAGMLVFISLFYNNSSDVWVYDDALNTQQDVGGLPSGVVLIAGVTNAVEQGIIQIVDTTNTYGVYNGGMPFQALMNAAQITSVSDPYVQMSMSAYIHDCVLFELNRPGSSLNLQTLISNNTQLISQFQLAANPAVETTVYTAAIPAGDSASCTVAMNGGATDNGYSFTDLQTYYTTQTNFDPSVSSQAGLIGYDMSNDAATAPSLAAYKNNVQQSLGLILGGGVTISAENLIAQSSLANTLNNALISSAPSEAVQVVSNASLITNSLGAGLITNQWMPIIRSVVLAIIISVIPFIVLFMGTSLVGTALKTLVGIFVWYMMWGITDVLTTNLATNMSMNVYQGISANSLGIYSIINMPSTSQKALVFFATLRTFGIGLASWLTMQLFRFGGGVFETMGQQMTGQVKAEGERAAQQALTPQGKGAAITAIEGGMASVAQANRYDLQQRVNARTASGAGNIESAMERMKLSGTANGMDLGAFEGKQAGIDSMTKTQSGRKTTAGAGGDARATDRFSKMNAGDNLGKLGSSERNAETIFGNNSTAAQASVKELENHGTLDKYSARAANIGAGFKDNPDAGPFHAGDRVDKHWSADRNEGFKVNLASRNLSDGTYQEIKGGKISTHKEITSALDGLRFAEDQMKDGHGISGRGLAGLYNQKSVDQEARQLEDKAAKTGDAEDIKNAQEMRRLQHAFSAGGEYGGKAGAFQTGTEGIRHDEAVSFTQSAALNGNESTTEAKHGSKTLFYNENERDRSDRDIREKLTSDTQRRVQENSDRWTDQDGVHEVQRDKQGRIVSSTARSTMDGVDTTKVYDQNNKLAYTQRSGVDPARGKFTDYSDAKGNVQYSTSDKYNTEKVALGYHDKKLMDDMNHRLEGLGSSARVQEGDFVETQRNDAGEMTNWRITRGGEKVVSDMDIQKSGKFQQIYDDRKEYIRGSEAKGSLNSAVTKSAKALFGEEVGDRIGEGFADAQGAIRDTGSLFSGVRGITGSGRGGNKGFNPNDVNAQGPHTPLGNSDYPKYNVPKDWSKEKTEAFQKEYEEFQKTNGPTPPRLKPPRPERGE